jgi:hypothetical protein
LARAVITDPGVRLSRGSRASGRRYQAISRRFDEARMADVSVVPFHQSRKWSSLVCRRLEQSNLPGITIDFHRDSDGQNKLKISFGSVCPKSIRVINGIDLSFNSERTSSNASNSGPVRDSISRSKRGPIRRAAKTHSAFSRSTNSRSTNSMS